MNSSSAPPQSPIPFRSKKRLQSTPNPKAPDQAITTQTPDKRPYEVSASRRARNRGVALSLKEIRQVATAGAQHRKEPPQREGLEGVKSVRRQIGSWAEEGPAARAPNPKPVPEDGPVNIPPKYEMLVEFFNGLDSTIRLLRLKGSTTTFTNISPKIECLTDRRFSHRHLAQLKHILPEAMEIKRVLVFDERTSCMKPDLQVNLNLDAIQCDDGKLKSENKYMHLRKVFRARLLDFHKSHPEGDDIPEESLPEPFNRARNDLSIDTNKATISSSPVQISSDVHTEQGPNATMSSDVIKILKPGNASHFSQAFQKRFSQKKVENIRVNGNHESISDPCLQQSLCTSAVSTSMLSHPATPIKPAHPATPIKPADGMSSKEDSILVNSKPMFFSSTPKSSTPGLRPPKRSYMSPADEPDNAPNKLVKRPLRTRSLKFDSPAKLDEGKSDDLGDVSSDDDILNLFPESLLQSIREKERKAKEDNDPEISQAKRRRQMIACLPKLFNMIHFLFQSIKRSVLTKEELLFKIITGHSDIVDRREVEEQLDLLLELAPEWISRKVSSSGDQLICINKMSSPEIIRSRLEEAR